VGTGNIPERTKTSTAALQLVEGSAKTIGEDNPEQKYCGEGKQHHRYHSEAEDE